MTYTQALAFLNGTLRFGSKPGLERISRLLALMGNPQDGLRFVHVAGTNGKGSTCSAVASALQRAGYKTGLYISPYVEEFRERIQIDGQMISPDSLAQEVERILPFVEQTAGGFEHPTEFEIITALALSYFRRAGCDIVVLEVGLGGRFDATNVIGAPLVSVITSIAFDHTEYLGDTLGKIAFEKCGIIKKGGVTVASPGQDTDALAAIMEACAARENTLLMPNPAGAEILEESLNGTRLRYKGTELFIPLAGRHQVANFLTAYEALGALGRLRSLPVPEDAVRNGFAAVRLPARMEVLHERPLVLLDGAHNLSGVQRLCETAGRFLKGRRIAAVMGMLRDKDYLPSVELVARMADSLIAVSPDSPRALEPEKTARAAERFCKDVSVAGDYGDALTRGLQKAGDTGALLICGSLYLAGPMRREVRGRLS